MGDRQSKGDIMPEMLFDPDEIPADLLEYFEVADFDARTSVLKINTEPSGVDHYAAYPKALVKPMILAGTSEYGCCANCGSPYERVVEKMKARSSWNSHEEDLARGQRDESNDFKGANFYANYSAPKHKGWKKACRCHTDERRPAVILDPFAGTGTTGLVALEYGRHFVGIELLPKYCKIARKRLESARMMLPGLFEEDAEETASSPTLFDRVDEEETDDRAEAHP